jgi:hypothetical protein
MKRHIGIERRCDVCRERTWSCISLRTGIRRCWECWLAYDNRRRAARRG